MLSLRGGKCNWLGRSGSLGTEKCDEFAERLIAEFVQSPDIPHCCAIIVIRIDATRGPRDLFLVLWHRQPTHHHRLVNFEVKLQATNCHS